MRRKSIEIKLEVLNLIFQKFKKQFETKSGKPYPAPPKATHYYKDSNPIFLEINRVLLREGVKLHLKNIWERLIKPTKKGNNLENSKTLCEWADASDINRQILQFINPNCLFLHQFLKTYKKEIEKEIYEEQIELVYNYERNLEPLRQLKQVYHLYISKKRGFKTGIMGVYDDGSAQIILNDNKNTHYTSCDIFEENDVIQNIRFRKLYSSPSSKNKEFFPEISLYLHWNNQYESFFFIEGVYSGVDTNNRKNNNPSLVSGPFILERILSSKGTKRELKDFKPKKKNTISKIIVARVSNHRFENLSSHSNLINVSGTKERMKAELLQFNINNSCLFDPDKLIGQYVLLIYSPTHRSIRKLTLCVGDDLVVTAKAIVSEKRSEYVIYSGKVNWFKGELLKIFINRDDAPPHHISCTFECSNLERVMFGVSAGVYHGKPKETLAILIKNTREKYSFIDFETPCISSIYDPFFKKLDNVFNGSISKFFSGEDSKKGYMIGTTYKKTEALRLLRNEWYGNYRKYAGIYEQYYLDHESNFFRKDFVQLLPSGEIYMKGRYNYKGKLDEIVESTISFQVFPVESGLMPVLGLYKVQQYQKDKILFRGTYCDISENSSDVVASRDIWFRVNRFVETEEVFFKRKFLLFKEGDETWNNLNSLVKDRLIQGYFNNRIAVTANPIEHRKMGEAFFQTSYQMVQSSNFNDKITALKILQLAFENGFSNKKELRKAIKGVFKEVANRIDIDRLTVNI